MNQAAHINAMQVNVLFPLNTDAFTYLVPEELEHKIKIGSLVRAPFKKGIKVGIVQSIEHPEKLRNGAGRTQSTEHRVQINVVAGLSLSKRMRLKTIEAVLYEEPLITENLLKLIQWSSQYYLSTSGLALKSAVPSGIFEGRRSGKSRITYDADVKPVKAFSLTSEQKNALSEINKSRSGVFLLHGVTGSGKTEVYLQAIEALGSKEAIVLVPEIALTAQIIERFRSRFHENVAFFHSGLSVGERISQWWKMRNGDVKIVVGVRSAVFAPFKRLGLIVIDEEQEASYKQFEGFKYSARDVALARAKIEGFKVILGSATPSIESFYNAKTGKFRYVELQHRIEKKPLPKVEIIDMTTEDKKTWSFSSKFLTALKENILKGYQSIIMLNRRGYSPFLMCTHCGYTYKCPACSITLTYHKDTKTLNCHYCNSFLRPNDFCPECKGTRIKYMGIGTQRVEEELHALIPELSLKRMDRDTTKRKLAHYRMIKEMEERKIDVLLGTQMVAKGHDFPDVTLAAVVFADVSLNLPDFRSSERTFQLFTQLAGRAGRGHTPGDVYIQTYEPQHYVFNYVRNHDYNGFYQKEVELRKELLYPPFSKLIRIVMSFRKRGIAKNVVKDISERINTLKISDIDILGPAPAPIEKIKNLWRWHLILKCRKTKSLRDTALQVLEITKSIKGIRIDVDVDPINLL